MRFKAVSSKLGEVIVARICPGSDLILGVEEICRQHQITSGTVVSGIGSLKYTTMVYVVPDKNAAVGASYVSPIRIEGPLELLAIQGTIGLTETNELSVHLHGMISDPHQQVYGGHLVAAENPVLATAELMICATPGVALTKSMDTETEFELFNPAPSGSLSFP